MATQTKSKAPGKSQKSAKDQIEDLLNRRNQLAAELERKKDAQKQYDDRIKELVAEHRDELFEGKKSRRFERGRLTFETRKSVSIPNENQTANLLKTLHACGLTTSQAGVKVTTTGYNILLAHADGQKVVKSHNVALSESEHLKID